MNTTEADQHDPAFTDALQAVEQTPSDEAGWDRLEELAEQLEEPDEVARAYRAALEKGLAKTLAPRMAERAVQFCQDWFLDSPEALPELLTFIVDRYPHIPWAFERLVVLLTSTGQWSQLLALYDKTVTATREEDKRRQLLRDAARLAKDFADQPDRAADYLQQLLTLEPENDKLVIALERLLERQERHQDLLDLWRSRLPKLPAEEARQVRAKIATISMQQLGSPEQAVAELQALIEESPGNVEACAQLEEILQQEDAPLPVRRQALDLLRKSYDIVQRPADVVRVIELALGFVDAADAKVLRRQGANRLAVLGRDVEAIGHFAALLLDSPDDTDARRQLRLLSRRSERHDLHAEALLAAAESSSDANEQIPLWLQAAALQQEHLNETQSAISLYQQVVSHPDADDTQARTAGHRLNELLKRQQMPAERLSVLERLASLESASFRRHIRAEAARLAAELDDQERALGLWRQILEDAPRDLEALSETITLLELGERWSELVEALKQRADAAASQEQQKADRITAAGILEHKLEEVDDSIDSWLAIREQFGEDAACLTALDRLMARAERWEELASLLDNAVQRECRETAARLVRLAEVQHGRLDNAPAATPLLAQALALNPADTSARSGMEALLATRSEGVTAAESLWSACRKTDDWVHLLELTDAKMAGLQDPLEQATLLAEAAAIREQYASDPPASLRDICRAVALDPGRRDLRSKLMQLAATTDGWAAAAAALKDAADAFGDDADAAAELLRLKAQISEEQLGDEMTAFEDMQAASELLPDDLMTRYSLARTAARAGRWTHAVEATVSAARTLTRIPTDVVAGLEAAAEAQNAWADLAAAFMNSVECASPALDSALASELLQLISSWFLDRCDDAEGAANATAKAIDLTPDHEGALMRLVSLQRRNPGPELTATLLKVAQLGGHDGLDLLLEAADVALQGDTALATPVFEKLYQKARKLWLAKATPSGSRSPEEAVNWAVDNLGKQLEEAGDPTGAADLLLDAAQLPHPKDRRASLRRHAADLLLGAGQRLVAIDAYRKVLGDLPDDMDVIATLAPLCEQEEASSSSVALRLREVELTDTLERRLALRLASTKRAAAYEKQGGRLESLLANLADQPGHEATIDALFSLLDERGQHDRLVAIIEEQASSLEGLGDNLPSAVLWSRAAEVSEKNLRDLPRAIEAHRRAVELTESGRNLDALARLHLATEEPVEAINWLQRRLKAASDKDRIPVMLKLAKTQLKANRDAKAASTLQTAFSEAPQTAEVRKLLIPLLRQQQNWAALASTLAASVDHAPDDATVLAYAREAAALYHEHLEQPGEAVPVLRRAVTLAPNDRKLKSMLADGLRAAGEFGEAAQLLTSLIESFGRRGSRERAGAHLLLAKVLHAQGDPEAALEQLDTAAKMDGNNVAILQTLATTAREAQQLERAEAALRTLLLTTRRLISEEDGDIPIGTSEVLFELSSIARTRGQNEQAAELAESAIEALAENDNRAPQLQQKLELAGEDQLLVRLLDARLGYTRSPYRRGQILADKANALQRLGKGELALDTRLEAIDGDPGSPLLHEGTRELAVELDQLARYVSCLEDNLVNARRDTDGISRCEILLRLCEIAEKEQQDYERASAYCRDAATLGVRQVDVLRAQARIAGARGDEAEQMKVLENLANLGEDQVESRADAQYRIAEVQLAATDSLEHGIESLRKALADRPRPERACAILLRAAEMHPDHQVLLDVYEQVARGSGDSTVLLQYLERRAAHPETTPDQVREAVSVAREADQHDRVEALMQRAVELAQDSSGGLYAVDWALLGLAEINRARGDVKEAMRWLADAAEVADPEPVFALSRKVAELADGEAADPAAAAKLYERLRDRDPGARECWEPLVRLYRKRGDVDALERVVRETLVELHEVSERSTLRLELGRMLLETPGRLVEAASVLRDALFDEPGLEEAVTLLAKSLEQSGRTDELIELLRDQLIGAQDRGDATAVRALTMRLGGLLDSEDAVAAYRDALRFGDDAELLDTLLNSLRPDHDDRDRASLSERFLALLEGADAAQLARDLAELYDELNDTVGQRRALEMGFERAPLDEELRDRLETYYRVHGNNKGLVSILENKAAACEDEAGALGLLREAAKLCRTSLADPTKAIELLQRALELSPQDVELCTELAAAQTAGGDAETALITLATQLENMSEDNDAQQTLLLARASIQRERGALDAAIEDLEAGYALDADNCADALMAALDQQRAEAVDQGDTARQRTSTLRSVEIVLAQGKSERALELLTALLESQPDDTDALVLRCDLERQSQDWHALATTCKQLIGLQEGEDQAASAGLLLEATVQFGDPAQAREVLERVWAEQPEDAGVRAQMRRLYELVGENRELAKLLILEAASLDSDEEKLGHLRWAGEALLATGDVVTAMPALQDALKIQPDDAVARCLLADANVMLARYDEAHNLLDEAIAQTRRNAPDLYLYHQRKAYVCGSQADNEGQLEALKRAHQLARKNGVIAADLANLAEAMEDWELAASTLRAISSLDEGQCTISPAQSFVRQGRIAHRAGDERKARMCARRASMADETDPDVVAFQAELGDG